MAPTYQFTLTYEIKKDGHRYSNIRVVPLIFDSFAISYSNSK